MKRFDQQRGSNSVVVSTRLFQIGPLSASFCLFLSFRQLFQQLLENMLSIKFCQWLDLNQRSLPTEPRNHCPLQCFLLTPVSVFEKYIACYSFSGMTSVHSIVFQFYKKLERFHSKHLFLLLSYHEESSIAQRFFLTPLRFFANCITY